jgi:hypothetical protein
MNTLIAIAFAGIIYIQKDRSLRTEMKYSLPRSSEGGKEY